MSGLDVMFGRHQKVAQRAEESWLRWTRNASSFFADRRARRTYHAGFKAGYRAALVEGKANE